MDPAGGEGSVPPRCPCRCRVQVLGSWVTHTSVQLGYKVGDPHCPPLLGLSNLTELLRNLQKALRLLLLVYYKAPPSNTRKLPKPVLQGRPCPSGESPELLLGTHSRLSHWPEVRVGAESASPAVTRLVSVTASFILEPCQRPESAR